MKKMIITGAGGFLGGEILSQVRSQYGKDYEIFNLSRKEYPELGIPTLCCDIGNLEVVQKLDFTGVEIIFHVAAIAGVWGKEEDFYRTNYLGTKNLIDHAKASGVQYFIYTSTPSVVFGKESIENGTEKLSYTEKYYTYYAQTKSLAERYVIAANENEFKTVSIRPHLIWGKGDPHLIPRIIKKAKSGKLKKVGDGDNLVDVIYVKNAAFAHLKAMEALVLGKEIGGNSYFVGQEKPVVLWDFIDTILKQKNLMPVESSVSFTAAYFIGYLMEKFYGLLGIYKPEPPMTRFVAMQLAKSHYFSHEKAFKDFGYTPQYTIEEALRETFS